MTSPSAARANGEAFLKNTEWAEPSENRAGSELLRDARRVVTALLEALREAEREPTDDEEPPWKGWFSCPECYGWFCGEGEAYENGDVLCVSCAEKRDADNLRAKAAP